MNIIPINAKTIIKVENILCIRK